MQRARDASRGINVHKVAIKTNTLVPSAISQSTAAIEAQQKAAALAKKAAKEEAERLHPPVAPAITTGEWGVLTYVTTETLR